MFIHPVINLEGYNLTLWTTLEVYVDLVLMEPFYENIICLFVFLCSPEYRIVVLKSFQHVPVVLVCLVQWFQAFIVPEKIKVSETEPCHDQNWMKDKGQLLI